MRVGLENPEPVTVTEGIQVIYPGLLLLETLEFNPDRSFYFIVVFTNTLIIIWRRRCPLSASVDCYALDLYGIVFRSHFDLHPYSCSVKVFKLKYLKLKI